MELLVFYITKILFILILLPTARSHTNGQVFHPLVGELYGKLKSLKNLLEHSWRIQQLGDVICC